MNKIGYCQSTQAKGGQKGTAGYAEDYYGTCPNNSEFNDVSLVINYDSK
jgi:hypothetical protein